MYRAFNDLKELEQFLVARTGLAGLNVEAKCHLEIEPAYTEIRILYQSIAFIELEVGETAGTQSQIALVLFDEKELDKLKTISNNSEFVKSLAAEDGVDCIVVEKDSISFCYLMLNRVELTFKDDKLDVKVQNISSSDVKAQTIVLRGLNYTMQAIKEMIKDVHPIKIN